MTKVKLLKPHTHAGRSYSEKDIEAAGGGIELTMHDESAQWLASLKKVEILGKIEDAPKGKK